MGETGFSAYEDERQSLITRGLADLTSVKPELTVGGTLQTRTLLAPFGYEEFEIVYGEEEDQSAGRLFIPKFPEEARGEKQGPSNSREKSRGDDGQGGSRRSEEPMQQDPDQAEKEEDKGSTGGVSSLDFNFLSDFESGADALETTEPANEGTSTLEPPSAFMETNHGITKEKMNRRRCQSTFLGNVVARRRVGGASQKP